MRQASGAEEAVEEEIERVLAEIDQELDENEIESLDERPEHDLLIDGGCGVCGMDDEAAHTESCPWRGFRCAGCEAHLAQHAIRSHCLRVCRWGVHRCHSHRP